MGEKIIERKGRITTEMMLCRRLRVSQAPHPVLESIHVEIT
jgi:hypothetical protein